MYGKFIINTLFSFLLGLYRLVIVSVARWYNRNTRWQRRVVLAGCILMMGFVVVAIAAAPNLKELIGFALIGFLLWLVVVSVETTVQPDGYC